MLLLGRRVSVFSGVECRPFCSRFGLLILLPFIFSFGAIVLFQTTELKVGAFIGVITAVCYLLFLWQQANRLLGFLDVFGVPG